MALNTHDGLNRFTRISYLLAVTVLFVASTLTVRAATMGFSGSCKIDSVFTSDRKIVFVLNGPCEILTDKMLNSTGSNAQIVKMDLDHGILVLCRTEQVFPTDMSWQSECKFCEEAIGSFGRLDATSATYTLEDGDLILIQTEHLQVGVAKD